MPNWRSQTYLPMDPLAWRRSCQKRPVITFESWFLSKTLDPPAEKRRDPASGRVLEFSVVENIEEFGAQCQLELSVTEARGLLQRQNGNRLRPGPRNKLRESVP